MQYDALAERVSTQIGVPPTHIRFWTVNSATNNPKTPVKRTTNPNLRQILNPMANSFNSSQRNDAFYLEILEMSLAEFDTKKNIKVTWLPEGITKEVQNKPFPSSHVRSEENADTITRSNSIFWFPRPATSKI